jgi:hypothetical protein
VDAADPGRALCISLEHLNFVAIASSCLALGSKTVMKIARSIPNSNGVDEPKL